MEMEVAVENNNMRNTRGRTSSIDLDNPRGEIVIEKTQDLTKDRDLQYKPPQMCKVALVGDSTVGKTTFCEMYCKSNFNYGPNYYMTFGAEIYAKSIKVSEAMSTSTSSDDRVNLIVVDSSGKDIYVEFLPKYWDKLDAIVLMIDLTSSNTFDNATTWLELTKNSLSISNSDKDKILGVLVGNKNDLIEQRVVSYDMAKQFANDHRLEYFECSAKQNMGLEGPFLYLAHLWLTRIQIGKENKISVNKTRENDDSRRRKK